MTYLKGILLRKKWKTKTKENVDDKIFWELQSGLTLLITCQINISILCLGQLIDNFDNPFTLNHPFSDIYHHSPSIPLREEAKDRFEKNIYIQIYECKII